MPRGGKREGAGRKAMPPEARELLQRLETLTGLSREDVLVAGLYALDRELRKAPKRRKGPPAVVT